MYRGFAAAFARAGPSTSSSNSRPATAAATARANAGPRSRAPAIAVLDAKVLWGGDDNGSSCVGAPPSYEYAPGDPGVEPAASACVNPHVVEGPSTRAGVTSRTRRAAQR